MKVKATIEKGEDGMYSVYSGDHIGKYYFGGYGFTKEEALADFKQSVIESFSADLELEVIDRTKEGPVSDDLGEEVKRYYSDNFAYISGDAPTLSILTNIARHFSEWQKVKMLKGSVEGRISGRIKAAREKIDGGVVIDHICVHLIGEEYPAIGDDVLIIKKDKI